MRTPWQWFADWQQAKREAKEWHHVGFVTGVCQTVDAEGEHIPGGTSYQIHSLHERGDGKRRVTTTGSDLFSAHAISKRARVTAWKDGGLLPELDEGQVYTPPKPRKPKPKPKPQAKLLVFTGGKNEGNAA